MEKIRTRFLDATVDVAIWLFKAAVGCVALEFLWRRFEPDGFFNLLLSFLEDSQKEVSAIAEAAILCVVVYTATRPQSRR